MRYRKEVTLPNVQFVKHPHNCCIADFKFFGRDTADISNTIMKTFNLVKIVDFRKDVKLISATDCPMK